MKHLPYILLSGLLLAACAAGPRREMNQAEAMLRVYPDSTMARLAGIPASSLTSEGLRARHALLLAMAQDKAYAEARNDSLVQQAYEYYNRHGSRRERMLASYYLASRKVRSGKTAEATFLFMEAEKKAQELGDWHYAGFAQEQLAELYANNYDHEEAIVYSRKAVASFTRSGDALPANLSRLDMARQEWIVKRTERAEALVDSLLASPGVQEPLIASYASLLKADILFDREAWTEAAEYYARSEASVCEPSVRISGNKALIQEHLGKTHRADSLMEVAKSLVSSAMDSTVYFACAHDLSLLRDDYRQAHILLKQATEEQNRSVSQLLARSVTHAQKAYFEEHYHLEQARRKNLLLIAVLSILSLLMVVAFIAWRLHQRKIQIEQERETMELLKKDLLSLQEEQKASGAVIDTLLQSRIGKIQELSGAFFRWSDEAVRLREQSEGKAMKEEIIAEFRRELRSLRDDPYLISDIEKAMDQARGQLMKRLRTAVSLTPGIQFEKRDYELLTLFFADFSTKSISFLMDMRDDAVRKRKSRYRQLFTSRGEAFSGFLPYLM